MTLYDQITRLQENLNMTAGPDVDQPDRYVWPAPPAPEAFRGPVGRFVDAVSPHTEADPVALLVQSLVVYGNVIGRNAFYRVEADQHTTNMNAILVGNTASGRKGTSYSQVRRPFALADPEWAERQISTGLSSGEGLIWSVRDPIERKDPIKNHGAVERYEIVIADHGVDDKRLLVTETEFSSTLKVAEREGNTLTAIMRQAWDSGALRLMTKTSPAKATGAHISIIGHIPQDELLRCISTTELANGFANRFLWVCVRRSKLLPDGGSLTDGDLAPIVHDLREAIAFGKAAGELKRDTAARAAWHDVYEHLSARKAGLIGAILSRAEAQVTRLSLLYALLDKSPIIRVEHLRAALALWEYCENSVRHIFGDALGDPVADAILGALRSAAEGLTRTEVSNLFGRNRDKQRIDVSLAALLKQDLARPVRQETTGRPIEKWVAVRLNCS